MFPGLDPVLYGSCTTSHHGRRGTRRSRSWSIWSVRSVNWQLHLSREDNPLEELELERCCGSEDGNYGAPTAVCSSRYVLDINDPSLTSRGASCWPARAHSLCYSTPTVESSLLAYRKGKNRATSGSGSTLSLHLGLYDIAGAPYNPFTIRCVCDLPNYKMKKPQLWDRGFRRKSSLRDAWDTSIARTTGFMWPHQEC